MRIATAERRRRIRQTKSKPVAVRVSYSRKSGVTDSMPAQLLDCHQEGCGLLLETELMPGVEVVVTGDLLGNHQELSVSGRLVWCRVEGSSGFRAGVQFTQLFDQDQRRDQKTVGATRVPGEVADYYEVLQVSPNADADMIHRVYRLLAQRYHPDNNETGDPEMFRSILDAYKVLADPESRAAYDANHRSFRSQRWKIFDQPAAARGVESEKAMRQGILGLLYATRRADPQAAGVSIVEMEELLAVPREHLEFPLWVLREAGLIGRTDNGRFGITIKGVEKAEEPEAAWQKSVRLLPQGEPVS